MTRLYKYILGFITCVTLWVGSAFCYTGTCGIWAHKRNGFVASNFAGTQAGFDAAKAYVGTNGSIFIYGGCEGSLTIGTLQDSVFVYAYDSAKWTVYGKAGSWRDRSGQARLDVDSLGIKVTGTAIVPRLGPASSAGSGGAIRIVDGVTFLNNSNGVTDLPSSGGIVISPIDSMIQLHLKRSFTNLNHLTTRGIYLDLEANPSQTPTSELFATEGSIYSASGNNKNFPRIEGHDYAAVHTGTGTVTALVGGTHSAAVGLGFFQQSGGGGPVTLAQGARCKVSNYSASTITTAYGSDNRVNNLGSGAITNAAATYSAMQADSGTITNAYGAYVANPTKGAPATITNNYGLYLENQTAGSTNYSIYAVGGTAYLGGGALLAGDPGATAGALRWAANRITLQAGTAGVGINKSDNSKTPFLVDGNGNTEMDGRAIVYDSLRVNRGIESASKIVGQDSLRVNKGLYVGGRFIPKIDGASATLNFGVPAAVPGSVDLTISVPGAAFGNRIAVGAPITIGANYILTGFVSAANTVTIRWTQIAGAAADPDGAGGTYTADVLQ